MYYIHTKTKTCCIMLSNKNLEFHMHYTGSKNCLGLHSQPTILWCIKYIFHVTLVWLHMNMTCIVRKSNLYIHVQLHYIFLALLVQIDWLKVLTIHNVGLLCTHLQCTTIGPCLAVWWDPTTARIRRRNSRTELENGQVWLGHSV